MAWFMKGSLCDAVPAFMSPSLLPGTGPASAFGTCTRDDDSQPLSSNSIPRPQLGLVHSPCPPNRSYRFAVGSPARGPAPRLAFKSMSLPWRKDLLDPLHRPLLSYSLHSVHRWRLTGSTWVGSCPFSQQAQGKVTCTWVAVPRVASVQVGAQCQVKDLALQSDPGKVEAPRQ